jgi:hypothetical protein
MLLTFNGATYLARLITDLFTAGANVIKVLQPLVAESSPLLRVKGCSNHHSGVILQLIGHPLPWASCHYFKAPRIFFLTILESG